MKILVTGANGFIGRHYCQVLLNQGHEVIGLSRKISRKHDKNVVWVEQDININNSINKLESLKLEAVIHLAWPDLDDYSNDKHLILHLPKHTEFLSQLIFSGINKLQVLGTCLEYGMQAGCLDETLPSQPTLPYAIAKNKLHINLQRLNSTHCLQWIRLFYLYGDGQRASSFVPLLNSAINRKEKYFPMSGGQQIRDYLDVKTVVTMLTALLETDNCGTFNCASNMPVRMADFAQQLIEKAGGNTQLQLGKYPYPSYEPMEFWGDNTKLFTAIGAKSLNQTTVK